VAVNVARLEYASLIRTHPAESVSGDAIVAKEMDDGLFVAMIDALGHGPEAHDVAVRAMRILEARAGADVCKILEELHEGLQGTRGCVGGVAWIQANPGTLHYAGIGNTVIRKFGSSQVRLVSRDGLIGERFRNVKVQHVQLSEGDVVMLYTDGVRDRFDVEEVPDILHGSPEKIVRSVIQQYARDHDDAACFAVRLQP
jgi:negative regulator of sigma-B (phosphoserine phosphatase)